MTLKEGFVMKKVFVLFIVLGLTTNNGLAGTPTPPPNPLLNPSHPLSPLNPMHPLNPANPINRMNRQLDCQDLRGAELCKSWSDDDYDRSKVCPQRVYLLRSQPCEVPEDGAQLFRERYRRDERDIAISIFVCFALGTLIGFIWLISRLIGWYRGNRSF